MPARRLLVLLAPFALIGLGLLFVNGRPTAGTTDEVVFARDGQLFLLNLAGNSERRLTNLTGGAGAKNPVWSPHGRYIVFSMLLPAERGALSSSDLYRVNSDGSDLKRLRGHQQPGEQLDSPAFLPDGSAVVFSRFLPRTGGTSDELQIVKLEPDSGQTTVLAKDGAMPAVSADGRTLAYVRIAPESFAPSLHVVDLAGGAAREIIPEDEFASMYWPHFSPSGAEIVFSGTPVILLRERRQNGLALEIPLTQSRPLAHGEPSDLFKVDLATGKSSLVTRLGEDDPTPIWSADGKRLLVIGTAAVYTAAGDGQGIRPMHRPGGVGGGDWRGR